MNFGTIEKQAQRLNASASRGGTKKINGIEYTLAFLPERGIYEVTDPEGEHVITLNTRKITEAKRWLAEEIG